MTLSPFNQIHLMIVFCIIEVLSRDNFGYYLGSIFCLVLLLRFFRQLLLLWRTIEYGGTILAADVWSLTI